MTKPHKTRMLWTVTRRGSTWLARLAIGEKYFLVGTAKTKAEARLIARRAAAVYEN